jgi:acetaldehyde dehydrogenase (acetylating)
MKNNTKIGVAIIGAGNIGTDLMFKVQRSALLEMLLLADITTDSDGMRRAQESGVWTSAEGLDAVLASDDAKIVFDATSATVHAAHAPKLKEHGKIAIDLTPAAVGPYVVPCVNMAEHLASPNVNLTTCSGQSTIPIVAAVSRVCRVRYAEVVVTTSSMSSGAGTRRNIDEVTTTTADGLRKIGGADESKAIVILNPADPPITMRNTIYTEVENADSQKILESVKDMVSALQRYVPGYRMTVEPRVDGDLVVCMTEVEGAGDYLPRHAGNLDISTAAAVAVGERFAEALLSRESVSA